MEQRETSQGESELEAINKKLVLDITSKFIQLKLEANQCVFMKNQASLVISNTR